MPSKPMTATDATENPTRSRPQPLRAYAAGIGRSAQTVARLLPPELLAYIGRTPYVTDEAKADAALLRPFSSRAKKTGKDKAGDDSPA
jgi:hypothetical protein